MIVRRTCGSFEAIAAVAMLFMCGAVDAVTLEEKAQPHDCQRVGPSDLALRSVPVRSTPGFPGVQLEVRTPFEPTAFPSSGRNYLVYELHLRNFADGPLDLKSIEVFASDANGKPLARFEAKKLESILEPIGAGALAKEATERLQLASGQSVVAFLCLAFDRGVAVPAGLRHRIHLADWTAEGPVIETSHTPLRVLAPPVAGADWIADGGPGCNKSHHRVGLLVADGRATISRRYGIDWKQIKQEGTFSGNALDPRSYHAYGENVLAVADGTVLAVHDGLPDNIPRTAAGFSSTLPITMDTIGGNDLTLDLGDGQFAYYAHLQAGSLRVKAGDLVRRGMVLGRIGNSGDSREPHLHFQVMNTPSNFAAEGVPYVIDQYWVRLADDTWGKRAHELPVMGALVNFEPLQPGAIEEP